MKKKLTDKEIEQIIKEIVKRNPIDEKAMEKQAVFNLLEEIFLKDLSSKKKQEYYELKRKAEELLTKR